MNNQNLKRGGITAETASRLGSKGGKAAAVVKREKARMSAMFADWLANEHGISIDGKMQKLTGKALLERVTTKIIIEGGTTTVQMMKLMLDATEGSRLVFSGDLKHSGSIGYKVIPDEIDEDTKEE